MIAKLYERKAQLEAREEKLRAELSLVKAKLEIVGEMIEEEKGIQLLPSVDTCEATVAVKEESNDKEVEAEKTAAEFITIRI